MKGFARRLWAFTLVLVMLVGLLPVVQFTADAATVEYRYSDDENQYIYNWGTREVEATFLSPNAEAFYTGEYTYEALSALDGAAVFEDIPSSALYTALQTLMTSKHTWTNNYDNESKPLFQYTDCQGSALLDDSISTFYIGSSVGPTWDGTWNREHTWPQSKGLEGRDEDDIMMLRPADSSVNSSRSNNAYGTSTGFYDPNSKSNGAYDLHGDVARIALYVYVRWGNTNLFGVNGVIESQDLLLQWMAEDPVDTWELGRNDSVESMTGTRNVFVDYPELAFALFEEDVPTMLTPSGEAVAANMNYTITPETNDSSMGTAVVYGNVVTAFPAAGCYVDGYTVSPEGAEVTQNGNAFTVNANQDCTVTINFGVSTTANAVYMEGGVLANTVSVPINEEFVLPGYHGQLPEGVSFWGWALKEFSPTENISTVAVLPAGETYTMPNTGVVFHAIYAYLDKGTQGGWTPITDESQLYAGNQLLLAAKNTNAVAGGLNSGYLSSLSASFLGDNIAVLPQDALILTLGGHSGAWTLTNQQLQLGVISGDKLAFGSGTTTWNITISDGTLTMRDTQGTSGNLQFNNSSPRFKVYTSTQAPIRLFVLDADTDSVHFATSLPAVCAHEHTEEVAAQAPTATQPGWTAGTYCYDCEKYIAGHTRLAPLVSCTLNFLVPEGIAAIPNTLCDANGITLPEADAPEGYTFVGWTTAPVAETTDKQTFYAAGESYKTYAGGHTTLYALYSRTEEVTGSTTPVWTLATSLNDLSAGKQIVIAAAKYAKALGTTQNTNNRAAVDITKNADGTITFGENVQILTLEAGSAANVYAFKVSDGKYLYASGTGTKNNLGTGALVASSYFTIAADANGNFTATAKGHSTDRNQLQYNNGSTKIFSCYSGTQQAICFYVKSEVSSDGGTVINYYTTMIGDECAHAETSIDGALAATCTTPGWTGDLVCEADGCGKVLAESQVIPATGHTAAKFVPAHTAEDTCTAASWAAHYNCAECGMLVVSKAVDAEIYTLPTAPGHDYTEDATTCGTCGHIRISMKLTTVTLRASQAAIYYKGEFDFDEETENSILSYGITASLYDELPTVDGSKTSRYTEGTTGALIANIMEGTNTTQNKANAKMPVYARAYVQLADGSFVYSDVLAISLKQMVQAVDAQLWDSLTPAQLEGLETLYKNFSDVVSTWNVPNLKEHMNSK